MVDTTSIVIISLILICGIFGSFMYSDYKTNKIKYEINRFIKNQHEVLNKKEILFKIGNRYLITDRTKIILDVKIECISASKKYVQVSYPVSNSTFAPLWFDIGEITVLEEIKYEIRTIPGEGTIIGLKEN